MPARIFYQDYLNNPYIYTLTLGQYPQNVKYTQKSGRGQNAVQYQIPDGYIVKTEVADQMLCCETNERSASGAVNAFLKKTNREKSKISGIHVFWI
ncbi:hypothetical protein GLOIN_2v1780678 [Rhizophagus irregularis DAOM 181602=DAOM 197198]|nr:hypothetical protein GLOIN_2v1780678 [Rhizophagus irregularis DAOM 181602=DAOM 197198]